MLAESSHTSMGVPLTFEGPGVVDAPSLPFRAPNPPEVKWRLVKSPPSRLIPRIGVPEYLPQSAGTSSGTALASAPNITEAAKCPVACRPPVGDGG